MWREVQDSLLGPKPLVISRVLTTHLVQWLNWVIATQKRNKERGGGGGL